MIRAILFALALSLAASTATADRLDHCKKYKFGSPEWWVCEQGSRGTP
mgnify:CR=1 FL=1